jgi:hypothetical protein
MLNIESREPNGGISRTVDLLFVHGAWHGAWCWEEHFLGYFAEKGYAAHAVDLRGHGQSPLEGQLRFATIGDYVGDVAAAVKQIERPVVIVGHSMGGFVVQHFMLRHGARGAALLATVPWYGAVQPALHLIRTHPVAFARANLTLSLFPIVEDRKVARELFLAADADGADAERHMNRLQDESWFAYVQMLGLNLPRSGRIEAPLLVIGAGADALFPPASQHATANRHSAECAIIDGAAHDIMLDARWRQAADTLDAWLTRQIE